MEQIVSQKVIIEVDYMISRRILIKVFGLALFSHTFQKLPVFAAVPLSKVKAVDPEETVFRAINGSPAENMK